MLRRRFLRLRRSRLSRHAVRFIRFNFRRRLGYGLGRGLRRAVRRRLGRRLLIDAAKQEVDFVQVYVHIRILEYIGRKVLFLGYGMQLPLHPRLGMAALFVRSVLTLLRRRLARPTALRRVLLLLV